VTPAAGRDPELVSVIIPTYNRARLIGRTLRSVLDQTWRPLEVLVIDDGSGDGTPDLVERLAADWAAQDFRIRVVRGAHQGVSCARNIGIEVAQGSYIQFLDSDDELLPDKIAAQVAALRRSEADYAVGVSELVDPDGRVTGCIRPTPPPGTGDVARPYFTEALWHVNAVLYRAEVCRALPPWEPGLIAFEDQLYACRLKLSAFRGVVVPEVSDRVHAHGEGSASVPPDLAGLRRYAESMHQACDRIYMELRAHERDTAIERRRLARFAIANAVRLSLAGVSAGVRRALWRAWDYAPISYRPLVLGLCMIALVSPDGLYRLWRALRRPGPRKRG
jgi:glycosyltransferase involved in cell wall biosynthesis